MTVTFNYTGRVEIDQIHFDADIRENAGVVEAVLRWDLSSYGFSPTAQVDVYFQGVYDQIHFGLCKISDGPGTQSFNLANLRKPLEATVTLKVVEKDERGIPLLLGLLNRFRPKQNGDEIVETSILPTQRDTELPVPWRVQTESGRPVLHISDKHDLYAKLTNSLLFMTTVIPAVIQSAFEWLVWDTDSDRDEKSVEDWKKKFVAFGIEDSRIEELIALEEPDFADLRSAAELVQLAIDKYSTTHDLLKTVADLFEEE